MHVVHGKNHGRSILRHAVVDDMKFSVIANLAFLASTFAAPNPRSESAERQPLRGASTKAKITNKPNPKAYLKYFKEPGPDSELGHYDQRYFTGEILSYEERGDTLFHLIRSYLTVFREREIETWIAHGTLLGWWWNGKIMPWDLDLDTQVSITTLDWLANNLNMTMHNYTSTGSDGSVVDRAYLLDVNPNYVRRARGDGMNVIDARWVDVRNGLFIDITGLAEVSPEKQPGIWSCKNLHRYRTRDIYPLRETMFEGVPALVPYSFDRILVEEYTARALTKTKHEGHTWNVEQKEWIKQGTTAFSKPSHDSIGQDATIAHKPYNLLGGVPESKGLANLKRLL